MTTPRRKRRRVGKGKKQEQGKNMIRVKKIYRKHLLRPLRLIHPMHHEDSLYDICYDRFFHSTGIRETSKVLSEVARIPALISDRPGYARLKRHKQLEEVEPTDGDTDIEAPSRETMDRIDNILGMLRPSDFDTAGFDDHSVEVTQETLIQDDRGSAHLVSLS